MKANEQGKLGGRARGEVRFNFQFSKMCSASVTG